MGALPVQAAPPPRPVHRPPAAAAVRRPAKPAAPPPSADDRILLAEQGAFDQAMAVRAEQEREANVLRTMQMEQLKRDDQAMREWIKLI